MSGSLEATLDDLALMTLRLPALFRLDQNGHLVATNEPRPERAPRLFIGFTGAGFVAEHRGDLPKRVVRQLKRRLDASRAGPDPNQWPPIIEGLIAVLEAKAPIAEIQESPAWRFPETLAKPEGVVAVGQEHAGLLRRHFPHLAGHLQEQGPCFAVLNDGDAVSVSYSAHVSPVVVEAGAAAIPAARGHAGNVLAAWAIAVRGAGKVPLYSSAGDDAAARAVAHTLGLRLFGVSLSIR